MVLGVLGFSYRGESKRCGVGNVRLVDPSVGSLDTVRCAGWCAGRYVGVNGRTTSHAAHTGLLGSDLLVARFVLDELQGFADCPDVAKSRRAHRGMETLDVLRREHTINVRVLDDEVPDFVAVDAKLIALARRLALRLLTNDAALARNAELQGVPTCNLRKLAADLSPAMIPGDFVKLALTASGRLRGQAVGHLEDGSLVVVNEGDALIGGPAVALRITSVVPTAVGRLVFAALEGG